MLHIVLYMENYVNLSRLTWVNIVLLVFSVDYLMEIRINFPFLWFISKNKCFQVTADSYTLHYYYRIFIFMLKNWHGE